MTIKKMAAIAATMEVLWKLLAAKYRNRSDFSLDE